MAETKFFQYKGKPLVRCGDTLYYGDMKDKYVIKMVIKSKQPAAEMDVADKVSVQLIDIASVWLQKALKDANA